MWCYLCGAIYAVQSMWCNTPLCAPRCCAPPMLEQTSPPPTRNLVGKTHSNLNQRAWPAWSYLIGIHAADKFANRARAAREGPFEKNVKKPLVF